MLCNMNRIKSLDIMREMSVFAQAGYLSSGKIKEMAENFQKGNPQMLMAFLDDPELPIKFQDSVQRILKIVKEGN